LKYLSGWRPRELPFIEAEYDLLPLTGDAELPAGCRASCRRGPFTAKRDAVRSFSCQCRAHAATLPNADRCCAQQLLNANQDSSGVLKRCC
jgi:hypothetical protein